MDDWRQLPRKESSAAGGMLGAAIYLFLGEPWWMLLPQGARELLLATLQHRHQGPQAMLARVVATAGSAAQATEAPARGKGAQRVRGS